MTISKFVPAARKAAHRIMTDSEKEVYELGFHDGARDQYMDTCGDYQDMVNEADKKLSTAVEALKDVRGTEWLSDSHEVAEGALIKILGAAGYRKYLTESGIE